MQKSPLIFSLITLLLFTTGCQEQTYLGSVEIIRGLSSYRPDGSSIIQENDCCFILSVDGNPVTPRNEDQGYLGANRLAYRQFEVPPGSHTVSVRYYHHVSRNVMENMGLDPYVDTAPESGLVLGPTNVPVNITAKHTYYMQSNFNGAPDTATPPHWQPELIDRHTKESAGKAALQ